jgi:hypothetical protein
MVLKYLLQPKNRKNLQMVYNIVCNQSIHIFFKSNGFKILFATKAYFQCKAQISMHVKASLHNAIAMHPLNKKTEEDF